MTQTHLKRLAPAAAVAALTLAASLAGTFTAAAGAATTPVPQYTLKIFRSRSSFQESEFSAINSNSDIIGSAFEDGARSSNGNAVLVQGGVFGDLGAPNDPKNVNAVTEAFGINNANTVVGDEVSTAPGSDGNTNAARWQGAGPGTVLVNSDALPVSGHARSINNHNEIVGFDDQSANADAWTFQNGVEKFLPLLPGGFNAEAFSINDNAQIVGLADRSNGDIVAAMWQNGAIKSLGALPGGGSAVALAVNASGVAVGSSTTDGGSFGITHAVVFQNGTVTDLNAPGRGVRDAVANAINSHGVIVGSDDGDRGAFVFKNGKATELNTLIKPGSGFTLIRAEGINDSGDIVGLAIRANRPPHSQQSFGYELTPVSGS